MRIEFRSIGKPHEVYVKQGIEDFTRRINNYFYAEWKIISPLKNAANLPVNEIKKQEAKRLLQHFKPEDYIILLDEKGKEFNSVELSKFIERSGETVKKLIFLIGGAFGVDEEVKRRVNFSWSLSRLVFPHMMVRLILAEQIYRCCTILRNEKYHHI